MPCFRGGFVRSGLAEDRSKPDDIRAVACFLVVDRARFRIFACCYRKLHFGGIQPNAKLLHSHREVSTTRLRIAESAQVRRNNNSPATRRPRHILNALAGCGPREAA
jgi:hypothetical protein